MSIPPIVKRVLRFIRKRASLIISLIALIISAFTLWSNIIDAGVLIIYKPTEFCIVRGFGEFPSDHIVLPVNIENTGVGAKTIVLPTLVDDDNSRFPLAGFLPELDTTTIGEHFNIARGITVPAKSFERYILVFHTEHWWEEASPDYRFRFPVVQDDQIINMRLAYMSPGGSQLQYWHNDDPFASLIIHQTVNDLALNSTLVNRLLNNADVQAVPELVTFLDGQKTGTYTNDCFGFQDLPSSPS